LSVLVGRPVRQVEVLAEHHGKLEPIRLQLDQRSADGRFLLPSMLQAPAATKALSPNDEVVMMVSDLGHACDATCDLPSSALEGSLFTPSDRNNRYAYIATVERPRLSPKIVR